MNREGKHLGERQTGGGESTTIKKKQVTGDQGKGVKKDRWGKGEGYVSTKGYTKGGRGGGSKIFKKR